MPKLTDHLKAVPDPPPDTEPPDSPKPQPEEGEPAGVAKKAAPAKKAVAKKAAAAKPKPESGGTGKLLSEATSLADLDDFLNVLYVGPQGTGKTTSVAHMANLGRVIYINAEGGVKKKPLQKLGVRVENIQVLPPNPEDLSYDYLESLFWEIKAELEEDPGSIIGVVWDSVTEIHIKILQNIRDYQNEKAARTGKSRMKETEAADLLDRFFTDISDYGFMTDQMKLLLRRYRDLPCHFAITALITRDKDDDGKIVYRPAVTPKLAEKLVSYVDMIAVTSVGDYHGVEEYRGQFRPIGKYEGKDRFGVTPRILIDPTFDRLFDRVRGEMTDENDSVMLAAKALRAAHTEDGADEAPDEEADAEPADA